MNLLPNDAFFLNFIKDSSILDRLPDELNTPDYEKIKVHEESYTRRTPDVAASKVAEIINKHRVLLIGFLFPNNYEYGILKTFSLISELIMLKTDLNKFPLFSIDEAEETENVNLVLPKIFVYYYE